MADNKKRYPDKDLDQIDRNILNESQRDGRISNIDFSERVGLSPNPCLERIRRLERQGFFEVIQLFIKSALFGFFTFSVCLNYSESQYVEYV